MNQAGRTGFKREFGSWQAVEALGIDAFRYSAPTTGQGVGKKRTYSLKRVAGSADDV